MKQFVLIGAVLIAMLMVCQTSNAQTFSVENTSFDVLGGNPPGDDILSPSFAAGTTPGLVIPGIAGATGLEVDVDGFTYGRQFDFDPLIATIGFSVDASAIGVPFSGSGVDIQAMASPPGGGEQNYDVYRTILLTGGGTNVQIHDADGLGPAGTVAPLGMAEPQVVPAHPVRPGVDGYDSRSTPGLLIYWTWDSRIWPAPPGSFSGADVMISSAAAGYDGAGAGAIFASAASLGLIDIDAGPTTDDIDALEVFDYGTIGTFEPGLDVILFSLDPLSPSLAAFGFTPGDVLASTGGGTFGLAILAGSLGLTPNDNLTALSVIPDADGDGVLDAVDLCAGTIADDPVDTNGCSDAQVDGDGDGFCDPDAPSAGPSVCSGSDAFPDDPDESNDNDNDGTGDNADPDDDNDGIGDIYDRQPLVASNNCNDNDGTNATLVSAQVIENQTCASKESVDVNGDNGALDTVVFGTEGDLRLISEKVIFTDTRVEVGGRLEVINADPCEGCPPPPPPTFEIGEPGPAGGVVFYVTDGGLHGLEAAPADAPFFGEWGCISTPISGVDGTAIGTGAQNTTNIIAGCATADIAARVADSYVLNGFEDWFVPSKDELIELRLQRDVVDGFVTEVVSAYWSSSECMDISFGCSPNLRAWCHRFDDINPEESREFGCARSQSARLRAVREF